MVQGPDRKPLNITLESLTEMRSRKIGSAG